MQSELRVALSLSVGLHAVALVGWPSIQSSVEFDVERAPTSMEIVLVASKAPSVDVVPEAPSPPPRETPSVETATPEPVPQTVVMPEHQGALSEVLPSYLRNPPPVYPTVARQQGWEGTVVIAADILPSGRCGVASTARSSGYPVLDDAALRAVRRWQFKPARRLGHLVTVTVEIPITFRLIETP